MKRKNIEEEFQNLENLIKDNEQIIPKLRTTLLKQLEVVRKCAKPRKSNKSQGRNQNSGLLKAVAVSAEMAMFAKWNPEDLHSRVEVTKCICDYVKENNLQKPENRRIIFLNEELKKLLRYTENEITYPHIQKYIGVHFVKTEITEDKKLQEVKKKIYKKKVVAEKDSKVEKEDKVVEKDSKLENEDKVVEKDSKVENEE